MYFKVLFMESKNYQEDLSHIRSMMERSSRFISLSGLSGVFAGLVALLGAGYVYFILKRESIDYFAGDSNVYSKDLVLELMFVGLVILFLAVLSGRVQCRARHPTYVGYSRYFAQRRHQLGLAVFRLLYRADGRVGR